MFDRKIFIEDLKRHEGVVLYVYPDPIHGAAAPTCGVGHLLQPGDPHYGKPMGTVITQQEMLAYLEADVTTAVASQVAFDVTFHSLQTESKS